MAAQISAWRQIAYYLGILMTVIGVLLLRSVPVSLARPNLPSSPHLDSLSDGFFFSGPAIPAELRIAGSIALIIFGGIMNKVGARGLAGAGVVLDPAQARQDLEPYSRMAGGMVKDALNEANLHLGGKPARVVMIKCTTCGKLNEEDSKFCQECGKGM